MALIEALNIKKYFPTQGGHLVKAVDDVSFSIASGETVGMVGESGCGKSTIGRVIMNLIEPTDGRLLYDDRNIYELAKAERRALRRKMGIVFQDPYSSLNPRMNVLQIVGEPLTVHRKLRGARLREEVVRLLEQVGLKPEHINRYPHQFSGGQRQRIGIARALALGPKFLILDEPTSALDVSVQAQVLNLIKKLQAAQDLTYLFITHDLNVVRHIADRVMVMYLGKLVEEGSVIDIFKRPLHPYTQALLSANPKIDPNLRGERTLLEGDVPSPADPPPGCSFHTRCPIAEDQCRKIEPELRLVSDRRISCHLV
ncbi:Oligopeptide ABC transporter, ATP-binding protein OppF (TC 3.A.1.5.1) [Olavius sp. associated proteobacterium Delta 1]|nr:Oligopeptide ABC transporter, ATP-binding protein OppF (TC 3.A.1.5.1) [Olavius sp. associated proteobacterium Delta 1]